MNLEKTTNTKIEEIYFTNHGHVPSVIASAKIRAHELRVNQTPCEKMLWEELREKKISQLRFLRQHPLFFKVLGHETFYIPDFFCFQKKLIIEVDGPIHRLRSEYDSFRTDVLEDQGLRVVRFTNDEVQANLADVVEQIKKLVVQLPSQWRVSKNGTRNHAEMTADGHRNNLKRET